MSSISPYSRITKNIRVSVQPEHLSFESNPEAGVFAFSYTVLLDNLGAEPVQLLQRHWDIYSADRKIQEVDGPGVLGMQPVIFPGESFQYTSGAVIHDPSGAMQGSYQFQTAQQEIFDVAIPRFDLLYPIVIH